MKIRQRVLLLALLGSAAAGFAVVHPVEPADPSANAPFLAAEYAPPLERLDTDVVRRGESLSDVFQRAALGAELSGLLLAVREQIDPRRIMPNTAVLIRRWTEDQTPRWIDVSVNADSTVRLNRLSLGWDSELLITPTVIDTVWLAARLDAGGSIYQSLMSHPELTLPQREKESLIWQLAHIYGWELNFAQDMRPEDTFRLAYEREARPDGSSRSGRIIAAEIVNKGVPRHAVYFDPRGDGGDYFNLEGQSLKLTFNRYPVAYPRITSNFSWRRYHPVLRRNRPHLGTDFGTGYGAPVRSTADGVIRFADWDGGYGRLIRIEHGNGYETRYAHLSRFARSIRRGTRVEQGQVIGYTGATGLATAPHLHYEFRRHGQAVDVRRVRLPAAPPVPRAAMDAFRAIADRRVALLAQNAPHPSDALPSN